MKLLIYEDYQYSSFYPIVLNRAVFDLKCGINTLAEKIKSFFPNIPFFYFIRNHLRDFYNNSITLDSLNKESKNQEFLCVKSNVIFYEKPTLKLNEALYHKNIITAFKVKYDKLKIILNYLFDKQKLNLYFNENKFEKKTVNAFVINYFFDLIYENEKELIHDIKKQCLKYYKPKIWNIKKNKLQNNKNLFIHPKANVEDGVYCNTKKGPILIDKNANIKAMSVLEGPCYIGKNTIVQNALIKKSSIFNECRIGGEIENSILLDYVNKAHEGFLGHSYIGSFVNFGALSTNSNLKNNYSNIKIKINNTVVESMKLKLGCTIGDHTKLGIGSLIESGSIIGFGCNLFFQGQVYPKNIPSFSWGGKNPFEKYDYEKFIKTAKIVFERRNLVLNNKIIKLYKFLFL